MQYWDEMHDKYGFSDGSAVPPDAQAARTIYVQAMNALLKKKESNTRVICFNHPGVHNPIRICEITAKAFLQLSNDDVLSGGIDLNLAGTGFLQENPDNLFDDALADAYELYLDDIYETTVQVNEQELASTLKEIDS